MKRIREIDPGSTQSRLKSGALLVDVRRQKEVDEVTYDVLEYMHIPLKQLENRWKEIPGDKELILACRSGIRSLKAAYFLQKQGVKRVSNLQGGLLKWVGSGLPAKGNVRKLRDSIGCDCSNPDCC